MPGPSIPADDIAIFGRTGPRLLISYLTENPESSFGDIKAARGSVISSITRDLALLEAMGVVVTDTCVPPGKRRGVTVRYHVDEARVEALLADLRSSLLD